MIDESEYQEHVTSCSSEQSTKRIRHDSSSIDHYTTDNSRNSPRQSSQVKIFYRNSYLTLND